MRGQRSYVALFRSRFGTSYRMTGRIPQSTLVWPLDTKSNPPSMRRTLQVGHPQNAKKRNITGP